MAKSPFGWRLSKDRSHLVVDGSEQRIIAVVRHMYLAERIPMREIVRRLDEMGILNRRGKAFGLSRVWEMIYQGDKPPPEAAPAKKRVAGNARKRRGG
jgi:hypothetical protein